MKIKLLFLVFSVTAGVIIYFGLGRFPTGAEFSVRVNYIETLILECESNVSIIGNKAKGYSPGYNSKLRAPELKKFFKHAEKVYKFSGKNMKKLEELRLKFQKTGLITNPEVSLDDMPVGQMKELYDAYLDYAGWIDKSRMHRHNFLFD